MSHTTALMAATLVGVVGGIGAAADGKNGVSVVLVDGLATAAALVAAGESIFSSDKIRWFVFQIVQKGRSTRTHWRDVRVYDDRQLLPRGRAWRCGGLKGVFRGRH